MASTDVPDGDHAPSIDDALGPRYPVDDIGEVKNCELHQPMRNISFKVAIGSVLQSLPRALHNNPIPASYARVMVDDIVPGYEDLEIDFPTPKREVRLGDVTRQFILWRKKYINFLGSAPMPPTPPVVVIHLHLLCIVVINPGLIGQPQEEGMMSALASFPSI
jgi:hypothetical protein